MGFVKYLGIPLHANIPESCCVALFLLSEKLCSISFYPFLQISGHGSLNSGDFLAL